MPGLHEIGLGGRGGALGAAQHREDRADRDIDIDVGRTIQRVEEQQETTARVIGGDRADLLDFLGGHRRQVAAPFVGLDQDVVGDDIELLLGLTLHIVTASLAQHAGEGALGNIDGNGLDRTGDDFHQQAQIGAHQALALLLDQELGERDSTHVMFLQKWALKGEIIARIALVRRL